MANKNLYTYKALLVDVNITEDSTVYRPHSKIVFPKESDYKVGNYMRYFFKRKNEHVVHETNKEEYLKIDDDLYSKLEINWIISGDSVFARKNNELEISSAIQKLGNNFKKINPLQFFKP